MKPMNIYLCGVGGQGIGLLSNVLTQACITAGYLVRGCDTHGLAQRGGTVVNNGDGTVTYTPKRGFRGTDTFKYTVNDDAIPAATSNEATVRVNVVRP